MLKRMTLLSKREDLDTDSFRTHWAAGHAQLALSLPGVCKYEQNRVDEEILTTPSTGAFSADGIVELYFTDEQTMKIAQASETGAKSIPDDELLFLKGWSLNIVETTGPNDHEGSKVMVPITLRDDQVIENVIETLTAAARQSAALETAVNIVSSSHARPRLWSEPVAPDLIFVCWFASANSAREAFASNGPFGRTIGDVSERASAYRCDTLTMK